MHNVGFFKRMILIVYDGLLLAGVTLVAYVPVYMLLSVTPASFEAGVGGQVIKALYLFLITFGFFGWFWVHGGQTLGMRAWNLYLILPDGKFVSWSVALVRYLLAIVSWGAVAGLLWWAGIERWYLAIGLGYTWILINPNRLAWHDILSNTRIVHQPRAKS